VIREYLRPFDARLGYIVKVLSIFGLALAALALALTLLVVG